MLTPQSAPLLRGAPPAVTDEDLRKWLLDRGVPCLPFALGEDRLQSRPAIVPSRRMKALRSAATAVCRAYEELCGILADDPSHLGEFFSLTPLQKMLWLASGSLWHGIARADIFCTSGGGLAVAEINSDTPSGVDEAYLLGLYAEARNPGFINPNAALPGAFLSVIQRAFGGLRRPSSIPTVGLIYPTDIPEDQGMVVLYRSWLENAGFRVISGSPANIGTGDDGNATVFGTAIDVLVRHYKTDWWCERTNVWDDARAIPDALPLLREIRAVVGPMAEGRLAVVNPFGAVVTQNKLSLAFFHEKIGLFSPESQEAIRRYIPVTKRFSSFAPGTLEREKDDWVLKSDYGCEGAEVIIGRLTGADAWRNALRLAVPSHWVAQRYFEAERQDGGVTENYGVYIAGGEPAGLYVRLSPGVTGTTAVVAPALERPPLAETAASGSRTSRTLPACNAPVRELLHAYTPTERWLPFRMPLLLYSAEDQALIPPYEETPAGREAREAGRTLAGLIAGAGPEVRGSVLIVCDLDGAESAAFASEVSAAAEIVLQIENIAHERESVPLRETLGALARFAPDVLRHGASHADRSQAPAAVILDRRRMDPVSEPAGEFNNRHWAYLPTIRSLEELGIRTILYLHPESDAREVDDLNEDFFQYHDSGLRLCYAPARSAALMKHGGLERLLDAAATAPLRRQTVFSYMLPPDGERALFAYNQEGTHT